MRGPEGSLERKAVKLDPTGNRERKGLMPAKTRKKIEIKAARGSLGIIAKYVDYSSFDCAMKDRRVEQLKKPCPPMINGWSSRVFETFCQMQLTRD